jgi:hypothetical protein
MYYHSKKFKVITQTRPSQQDSWFLVSFYDAGKKRFQVFSNFN